MINEKATISVVIPSRNRPGELQEAVNSVFAQSRPPDEIIIVDDGSYPPVSGDIFTGCPAQTKPRLFRNDRPMGANNARNLGIRESSAAWIAFLDDDDRFKPAKIESLGRVFDEDPDADLVYHPAEILMVNEGVRYISKPCAFARGADVFRALMIKNFIGGSSMVAARRDLLIRAGLFDGRLPALQDYELWLRLANMGAIFRFVDIALTVYRCRTSEKSISKSIEANKKAVAMIEKKYRYDHFRLAPEERRRHEVWKKKMLVHKALLNGEAGAALKEQVKQFIQSPNPGHLLGLLAISLGTRMSFRLRSWMKKEFS